MRIMRTIAVCCALAAASVNVSLATTWTTSGFVMCDANQNGQIDSGDTPLTGVLVVITNSSGTYSNAGFTSTPDGGFIIQLPGPDTYTEHLHPATLPADATSVIPGGGTYSYTFTIGGTSNFIGDFLIHSASCATNTPPSPQTNCCEMTACASISSGKCIKYILGGNAKSSGGTNADSGKWDVLDVSARLHLEADVFDIVICGTYTNGNCVYHYMDFQGVGTLKGVSGCKSNFGVVSFNARVEDGGNCGCPDRVYVRVFSADGTTVLLIGGDMSNPDNVVTVPISKGDLSVREVDCGNSCHGGKGGDDNDHNGKGDDNDHGGKGGDKGGKGGDCGNGKGGNQGGSKGGDKGGKGGDCDNGKGGDKGGDKGGKGGGCDNGKGGDKGGDNGGGKGGDKGGKGGDCGDKGSKGSDKGKGGGKGKG